MRYYVNGECIGCGLCSAFCPAVFEMTDAGVAQALDRDVNAADMADAAGAMGGLAKVRYMGPTPFLELTSNRVYGVMPIEGDFYRIVDDSHDNYSNADSRIAMALNRDLWMDTEIASWEHSK